MASNTTAYTSFLTNAHVDPASFLTKTTYQEFAAFLAAYHFNASSPSSPSSSPPFPSTTYPDDLETTHPTLFHIIQSVTNFFATTPYTRSFPSHYDIPAFILLLWMVYRSYTRLVNSGRRREERLRLSRGSPSPTLTPISASPARVERGRKLELETGGQKQKQKQRREVAREPEWEHEMGRMRALMIQEQSEKEFREWGEKVVLSYLHRDLEDEGDGYGGREEGKCEGCEECDVDAPERYPRKNEGGGQGYCGYIPPGPTSTLTSSPASTSTSSSALAPISPDEEDEDDEIENEDENSQKGPEREDEVEAQEGEEARNDQELQERALWLSLKEPLYTKAEEQQMIRRTRSEGMMPLDSGDGDGDDGMRERGRRDRSRVAAGRRVSE